MVINYLNLLELGITSLDYYQKKNKVLTLLYNDKQEEKE